MPKRRRRKSTPRRGVSRRVITSPGIPREAFLEQQLRGIQRHRYEWEDKRAKMGIHAPVYFTDEINELKKRESSLRGQITRERNRIAQYTQPEYNDRPVRYTFDPSIIAIPLMIVIGLLGVWLFGPSEHAENTRVSPDRTASGEAQIIATKEPAQQLPAAALKPATVVTPRRIGVRYRTAPNDASVDSVNPTGPQEGETVYLLERAEQADGVWWKVQLQDGRVGYIREQFLSFQP